MTDTSLLRSATDVASDVSDSVQAVLRPIGSDLSDAVTRNRKRLAKQVDHVAKQVDHATGHLSRRKNSRRKTAVFVIAIAASGAVAFALQRRSKAAATKTATQPTFDNRPASGADPDLATRHRP